MFRLNIVIQQVKLVAMVKRAKFKIFGFRPLESIENLKRNKMLDPLGQA